MSKRDAILYASLHLLANKGFHGFSIKQVADHAGVAAGTVYLYFADREDLILQLHRWIMEKMALAIFAHHQPDETPITQYRQVCRSFWRLFISDPDMLLSKVQFDHLPPDVLRVWHTDAKTFFEPLTIFFASGRQESMLKDLPDDVLFCLGFEHHFALARRQMLGLVTVDDEMLEKVISAGWDAIALNNH